MKSLILLLLAISTSVSACKQEQPTSEIPKTKTACITVYDPKVKKEITKCKEVTIQEKYEGIPIPKSPK